MSSFLFLMGSDMANYEYFFPRDFVVAMVKREELPLAKERYRKT